MKGEDKICIRERERERERARERGRGGGEGVVGGSQIVSYYIASYKHH